MEAAASRAAQKSLKMRRLIQRQRETGSYLAIALLCLTLIDMVGGKCWQSMQTEWGEVAACI